MNFKHINTLEGHTAAIYTLCQGAEPHLFYSAGSDRQVVLWDLRTMKPVKVVSKSPTTVISLNYINSLNYLLIGQVEGGVHIIDLNQAKEVKYLKLHQSYVFDICYLEDKKEVVFSSGDGSISIWSVPDFKLLYHKKISEKKNRKMDISSVRNELAVASGDGKVFIFNTQDWSLKNIYEGFKSSIDSVKYDKLSNFLLVGEKDALLHQIDLKTGKIHDGIAAHYWAIYDIAFSPNKAVFATASRDKTVKIWNANENTVLKRFEGRADQGHTHSVNALLWTSYRHILISAGDDKNIKLWQVDID